MTASTDEVNADVEGAGAAGKDEGECEDGRQVAADNDKEVARGNKSDFQARIETALRVAWHSEGAYETPQQPDREELARHVDCSLGPVAFLRTAKDVESAPVMMQLMTTNELLSAIDEEISRLEQVKSLLIGEAGTKTRTAFSFGANRPRKRRALSATAKAKIRAAQKKRWAEWHKTHPKK